MSFNIARYCALAALALATFACGGPHYQQTTIDTVVSPTGGTVSIEQITVPLGGAVKAHLVALNSDGKRLEGGVTTDNAQVMAVQNVITGADDWTFLGVSAGTTVVHLQASGVVVQDITATVVDVQDVSGITATQQ